MAQNLEIKVDHQPLNKVLYAFSSKNNCSISFDDQLLSFHYITIDTTFTTIEAALSGLLRNTSFKFEKLGEVFILYHEKELDTPLNDSIVFRGAIYDLHNYEPLPYTQMLINKRLIYTNNFGHFALQYPFCDSLKVSISYLGYSGLDTTISCKRMSLEQEFFLKPTLVQLSEVTVCKDIKPDQPMIGMETGKINMNQRIANYLPGTGDNSVCEFLGLMPGVQRSTSDGGGISVWGSNPNRTEYDFDGFRIYNPDHFYGNIGVVNDLSIKNVQVQKGAGSAINNTSNFGRVEMIGKVGNRIRPSLTAEVNNLTTNVLFETPAGAHNTLLLSARALYRHPENTVYFRQTIQNRQLLPPENDALNQPGSINTNYLFGDILLKFSGAVGSRQNYYISLYQSYDENNFDSDSTQNIRIPYSKMQNRWGNSGIVAYFSQKTNKNFSYEIKAALASNFETNQSLIDFQGDEMRNAISFDGSGQKQLWDLSLSNNYEILLEKHQLNTGFGFNYYQIKNLQKNNDTISSDGFSNTVVPYFFLQDKFYLGNRTNINFGGRLVYSSLSKHISLSPNLSLLHSLSNRWSLGFNAGRSHNHILKVQSAFDLRELNNLTYWSLADGREIQVEQTNLLSTSMSYNANRLNGYVELYLKRIQGLTERASSFNAKEMRMEDPLLSEYYTDYYNGKASISGISSYLQYTLKNFMLWCAYDFNYANKQFDELYDSKKVEFAYNHQHQFKTALLLKTGKWVWSTTLKYGSGYKMEQTLKEDKPAWFALSKTPYFRWDASVVCAFNFGKLNTSVGASLLNITDYNNLRYQQISNGTKPAVGLGNVYYEINSLPRTISAFIRINI